MNHVITTMSQIYHPKRISYQKRPREEEEKTMKDDGLCLGKQQNLKSKLFLKSILINAFKRFCFQMGQSSLQKTLAENKLKSSKIYCNNLLQNEKSFLTQATRTRWLKILKSRELQRGKLTSARNFLIPSKNLKRQALHQQNQQIRIETSRDFCSNQRASNIMPDFLPSNIC